MNGERWGWLICTVGADERTIVLKCPDPHSTRRRPLADLTSCPAMTTETARQLAVYLERGGRRVGVIDGRRRVDHVLSPDAAGELARQCRDLADRIDAGAPSGARELGAATVLE